MTTAGESLATSEAVLSLTAASRPLSGVTDAGVFRAETGGIDLLGVLFDPASTEWADDVADFTDRIDRLTLVTGHDDVSAALRSLPAESRDLARTFHAEKPGSLGEIGIRVSATLSEGSDVRNSRLVFVDGFEQVIADTPLQPTFRFLHTLSEATAYTDTVLHVSLDPTACDDRAVETVAELFDSVVDERP